MYKDKTVLGIIPARGGSKGLPGKNLRPLMGKPLIVWTIEQALQSKCLSKVIVNTDDAEIAAIAREAGTELPFIRPKELAGDTSSIMDVIFHTLDFLKGKNMVFDYIALLEPTSPLRKPDDIDKAIRQLLDCENKADSLVSVGEVHLENPAIIKRIAEGYVKPYEALAKNITRRQDMDKVYFPYGVIYLASTEKLLKSKTFYQEQTIPYFIERWQNYEVDDLYDFICIEAILEYTKRR